MDQHATAAGVMALGGPQGRVDRKKVVKETARELSGLEELSAGSEVYELSSAKSVKSSRRVR